MKFWCCAIAGLSAIVVLFQPVVAHDPNELPETRIVLRMSDKFIQGLVGKQFQRDESIDTNIGGVAVAGTARVAGKFQIVLRESQTECDFDVLVRGRVLSQLTATRRPVVFLAHGEAPFSGRRRIVHQGDEFTGQMLTMDVRNHFTLDEICSFRGGLTGAATRRIARPFVRRGLADGDREADDEIRTQMTQALDAELDKLVLVLNKIPPLLKQAHQLIVLENKPAPKGLHFYRAATKEHLLFSIGESGRRVPNLPNLDGDQRAPLELWIGVSKNALTEERRNFILRNWRLIAPFLRDQLQRRSPELTKEIDEPLGRLLDEVQIHQVPGWHVLTFAPKIPLPPVDSP